MYETLVALLMLQPDSIIPNPLPPADSITEAGSLSGQLVLLVATMFTGIVTVTVQIIGLRKASLERQWLKEDREERLRNAQEIERLLKAEQEAVRARLDSTAQKIEDQLGVATHVLDKKLDQHTVAIKVGTAASKAAQHEANQANRKIQQSAKQIVELRESYLALLPSLERQQAAIETSPEAAEVAVDTRPEDRDAQQRRGTLRGQAAHPDDDGEQDGGILRPTPGADGGSSPRRRRHLEPGGDAGCPGDPG